MYYGGFFKYKAYCVIFFKVSNWFANARRRLKKTVNQDVSWARRINLYNRCIHGNAELLSNCSETSLYDDITSMVLNIVIMFVNTSFTRM